MKFTLDKIAKVSIMIITGTETAGKNQVKTSFPEIRQTKAFDSLLRKDQRFKRLLILMGLPQNERECLI